MCWIGQGKREGRVGLGREDEPVTRATLFARRDIISAHSIVGRDHQQPPVPQKSEGAGRSESRILVLEFFSCGLFERPA